MSSLSLSVTADGSNTLFNKEIGEHYHSHHGALQESRHVFLGSGLIYHLEKTASKEVSILEVGFGTGLNFLLTADHCLQNRIRLHYTGIEAYPLSDELIASTGYSRYVPQYIWNSFLENYSSALRGEILMDDEIFLQIDPAVVSGFISEKQFDIIYFDAFSAIHQPEMWTHEILEHICRFLKPGGVFVTYAITGNLKRSMKSLGFKVEKAAGAPGKREMLRAVRMAV